MKRGKFHLCVPAAAVVTILSCLNSAVGDPYDKRSAVLAGEKAPAFRAVTVDGKTINFPDDYKGKVVLLDFWATWCPPCRAELPNVVAAYNQYHAKGLEILSVSMDKPQQGPALLQFFKANNMSWPQIYDGHGGKTPIAVEYGVHAIPCPVLVDGDTGMILAADRGALGHRLTNALDTALAGKTAK